MFMKPLQDFLISKGYQKGFAFYKMKLLESLGMSPMLATDDDWRRVYTTNEQKYSFESFVSYNKNLFKEFDKWQKKA